MEISLRSSLPVEAIIEQTEKQQSEPAGIRAILAVPARFPDDTRQDHA